MAEIAEIEDLGAENEGEGAAPPLGVVGTPKDIIADADMSLPLDPLKSLGVPDDEDDDDDDADESLAERLLGLTEMLPDSVRKASGALVGFSMDATKWFYSTGRVVLWVAASSAVILALPVMFETERAQVEEHQMQQQRQLLLGPNAAVSGGGGLIPGAMPQIAPPSQR